MNTISQYWNDMKNIKEKEDRIIKRQLNCPILLEIFYDCPKNSIGILFETKEEVFKINNCNGITVSNFGNITYLISSVEVADMFFSFVQDFFDKVRCIINEQEFLFILKDCLLKWQYFFAVTCDEKLSKEKEQGLIGELLTILQLNKLGFKEIIENWEGPLFGSHDFRFNKVSIETKTIRTNKSVVRIHGVDQLFSQNQLFLLVYSLKEDKDGMTIHDIVQQVTKVFSNYPLLYQKLSLTGYLPHYDPHLYFFIDTISCYDINDTFPKIPFIEGIEEVEYSLQLDRLVKFKVDDDMWNVISDYQ